MCETFGAQCATIRKTKTEQRIKKIQRKTKAAQDGKENQEEAEDEVGKEPQLPYSIERLDKGYFQANLSLPTDQLMTIPSGENQLKIC